MRNESDNNDWDGSDRRQFHFSKSIGIPSLMFFVFQTALLIWFGGQSYRLINETAEKQSVQNSEIRALQNRMEDHAVKIATISESHQNLKDDIGEIKIMLREINRKLEDRRGR
jgi:hypothetical protein